MILDRDITITTQSGVYTYTKGTSIGFIPVSMYSGGWQTGVYGTKVDKKYTYLHFETQAEANVAYQKLYDLVVDSNVTDIHRFSLFSSGIPTPPKKEVPHREEEDRPSTKTLLHFLVSLAENGVETDEIIKRLDTITLQEVVDILSKYGGLLKYVK